MRCFFFFSFQFIGLLDKFISSCDQLTTLLWPNFLPHKWNGGPYKPEHAVNVKYRLKEILSLRTLHKQLSQLLSLSEQEEMRMSQSFEPFNKMIVTQYRHSYWKAYSTVFWGEGWSPKLTFGGWGGKIQIWNKMSDYFIKILCIT